MWFDSFTHDSSIDIDDGRNARDDDDEGDNDQEILPKTRKLCTPQNECTPIDWMLASLICNTSNLVNGIKIGLIVSGLRELLMINTWIFGFNDFTGIVLTPSRKLEWTITQEINTKKISLFVNEGKIFYDLILLQ